MLKMIHGSVRSLQEIVEIGSAQWPAPFEPGLEYNSPAHGNWNIVHMGMLLPEAHQIYVCAGNCNRGVVLTAAEMDAADRFSYIEVREEDLYNGEMENLVIDGVAEILNRLEKKPEIILLFTVCLHHFMGVDLSYIYQTLRDNHPDLYFVDCYMDCIMQKEGLTPDQKLRIKLYDLIKKRTTNPRQLNIVGSDYALRQESEIHRILRKAGWSYRDLTEIDSLEEYAQMGESCLNICTYPLGQPGLNILSDKLDIPGLYLPMAWDYGKIDRQLVTLCGHMGLIPMENVPDKADLLKDWIHVGPLKESCEEKIQELSHILEGRTVALDASATPQVLGLAKYLLSHGIKVTHIYGDAFLPEEKDSWDWLQDHAGHVKICSVIHHNMRVRDRIPDPSVIAVGQKAAYFHQTPHFVNMVEGGGLYGYDGILTMLDRIRRASEEEKEIEDTIRRKGVGLACLL